MKSSKFIEKRKELLVLNQTELLLVRGAADRPSTTDLIEIDPD